MYLHIIDICLFMQYIQQMWNMFCENCRVLVRGGGGDQKHDCSIWSQLHSIFCEVINPSCWHSVRTTALFSVMHLANGSAIWQQQDLIQRYKFIQVHAVFFKKSKSFKDHEYFLETPSHSSHSSTKKLSNEMKKCWLFSTTPCLLYTFSDFLGFQRRSGMGFWFIALGWSDLKGATSPCFRIPLRFPCSQTLIWSISWAWYIYMYICLLMFISLFQICSPNTSIIIWIINLISY